MNNSKVMLKIRIKDKIDLFTKELFYYLFENDKVQFKKIKRLYDEFTATLSIANSDEIWDQFILQIETIRTKINLDAKAIEENDPAAKSIEEVYYAYPGFYAIVIYRLSHEFHKLNLPIVPRIMSEYAHSKTGTDIHPGAQIGDSFFIDHATGTVIGETVIINNNVKIYQGVTLGAFHISKNLKTKKRHPTIGDNVIIYANATILGGETIIGKNSTIGANVWITESIPENSFVYHEFKSIVKPKSK